MAIESALNQTFQSFELLISNDCSSDDSQQIIEEYALRDSRIVHWTNEKNLGLFANYNRCMSRARGMFIKPFAQDDLLDATMLQACVDVLSIDPSISLLSTDRTIIDDNGNLASDENDAIPRLCEPGFHYSMSPDTLLRTALFPMNNFIGEPSTVMFRRASIGEGFDETLHHLGDLEYWLRIVRDDGGRYIFLHVPLCSFRAHSNSASSRNMQGLLTAIDLLRIGRKLTDVFASLNTDMDRYLNINMKSFAAHIVSMFASGKMSFEWIQESDKAIQKLMDKTNSLNVDPDKAQRISDDLQDLEELCFLVCTMFAKKERPASCENPCASRATNSD